MDPCELTDGVPSRLLYLADKAVAVVRDHQYALLFWAWWSLKEKRSAHLVSIDYHPDTDPPFFMHCTQKAVARDPQRAEALTEAGIARLLKKIDSQDLKALAARMPLMNNDEQIRTAVALHYLRDYHMINAMAVHDYGDGRHYRVPPEFAGRLSDDAFEAAGFEIEALDSPFILDIDLDYFTGRTIEFPEAPDAVFNRLVRGAAMITIARSPAYFRYLNHSGYTLEDCEADLLAKLKEILGADS